MKVVTASEMQEIDRKTIKDYGIPGHVLMERAGLSVAKKIKEEFKKTEVIVLSGRGNNAGDGIVTARKLYKSGWNVKVILLAQEEKLSPDCLSEYRIAKKAGVPMEFRTRINEKDIHGAIIVDAIFGTGISKPIKGVLRDAISFLNASGSPVVSVDIPSGVSSDTGEVMGAAVKAAFTVTFGLPKRGHFLYPGAGYTGKLFVEDIGFPEGIVKEARLQCQTIEKTDILIPERPMYSHKGDYGHVLLVAGGRGKTGAALMAAKACMRTGAGLVTIAVPESLMNIMQSRVTEEMTLALPEKQGGLGGKAIDLILKFLEEKADVLAIGPGIGVTKQTEKLIKELILKCTRPMVIDADGINILKKNMLKDITAPLVLTPHPGEMAGLLGTGISDIERDRISIALLFVKDIPNAVLVLKGVPTIVASKEKGAFINTTGNPGMAKAGVGDVLTGMLAGLLSQGLNTLQASVSGVYLHSLAGDISASKKGLHSLIAGDIIEAIGEAFLSLKD